jgi:predicted P-loop ATPase
MLGAVGKVLNQDQNFMLVLDGRQDIGKSHLVRWLCPLPEYFIEGAIQPDDKDSQLRLMRHWLWEVGELQATTRKADREALKNFVTMRWVTVRKPFGRYDLKKPACASMIGTINESGAGFLDDRTGNRRFAVVNMKHIDWSYTRLDVSQIWAEIMASYRQGERGALSPDEKREQSLINAGYGSLSTVEEYLWEYYEVDPNQDDWLPVRDILATLELNGLTGNQRANLMELGQILKAKESEGVTKGRPKIEGVKTTSYKGIGRTK